MIIGTGIDIIDVKRFKIQYEKENNTFFEKLFTNNEIDYVKSRKTGYINFAGKFAAKEAFFKALGTGKISPFKWKEVEVIYDSKGKPELKIKGKSKESLEKMEVTKIHLSISHIEEIAVAFVILEK